MMNWMFDAIIKLLKPAAQRDVAEILAKQMQETRERIAYNVLTHSSTLPSFGSSQFIGGGATMPGETEVFAVVRAANGFYAKMASGKVVVGMTLSEVCTAAQAMAAEDAITEDDSRSPNASDPLGQDPWTKALKFDPNIHKYMAKIEAYKALVKNPWRVDPTSEEYKAWEAKYDAIVRKFGK